MSDLRHLPVDIHLSWHKNHSRQGQSAVNQAGDASPCQIFRTLMIAHPHKPFESSRFRLDRINLYLPLLVSDLVQKRIEPVLPILNRPCTNGMPFLSVPQRQNCFLKICMILPFAKINDCVIWKFFSAP